MDNFKRLLPPLSSLVPFEAAARLESFSKASEELHLTQAAISKQIRSLEEFLGVALFIRRNRAVFLTAAGVEFRDAVRTAFLGIASRAEDLKKGRDNSEVVLVVQLCEAFYWLTPNIPSLHKKYPDIEVRLNASTQPITETAEKFDIAIQTSGRAFGDHTALFTLSDEVFPVCSPRYLASFATQPPSLEDLADLPLLHHVAVPQDWSTWSDWLSEFRIKIGEPKGKFFDSYPVMMQACVEGFGFALGWRRTSEKMLASGELVRPFSESVHLPEALSVYKWRDTNLSPPARQLLDWLKSSFSD
ncbi:MULTISPECIES: LysR substrate-binding domain-containing protein [Pseudomonas]|uniref:LysR substrate-binding domain-containing protein n=1 Tax=Pseudomonas TaxID=286 RepID=UPI000B35A0F7|nr:MULTISPECIES: LysR substrate-binding domain-containing protein [Pseudomonas]PMY64052.1 LysR family transcriptional regulator [Pseudomonas sp. FW305-25]PMY68003.1 LysR family transcriptional regulator [Pseudomonas sp. FW126-L8]PNA79351.1 LysR family transcriptional regulator [Pseudomonas sp. FW305-76]